MLHATVHDLLLVHWTPPFWQVFWPWQWMSHVSAVHVTPDAHAPPVMHTVVHCFPPHVTGPF